MFGLSITHWLIVGIVAVLLFGKRLPEVARSAGKSLTEFKKGMRGIEDDLHSAIYSPTNASSSTSRPAQEIADDREEATAPKFEPPAAEPRAEIPADRLASQQPAAAEAPKV